MAHRQPGSRAAATGSRTIAVSVAAIKRREMAKSLKLVVFDCDGTLVDSQHLIVSAMTSAYEAHAMAVPDR